MNAHSIPPCPANGIHTWMFRASWHLFQQEGATHEEVSRYLHEGTAAARRPIPAREYAEALRCGYAYAHGGRSPNFSFEVEQGGTVRVTGRWHPHNPQLAAKAFAAFRHITATRLVYESPSSPAHYSLSRLYRGNYLICAAPTVQRFETKPISVWESTHAKLVTLQFLVPQPMLRTIGLTQDGRLSQKSNDNTGARRFIVYENDTYGHDEQARVIWHLRGLLPLVMVVDSGNKSLQAWFACAHVGAATQLKFFSYAHQLGADPATWTLSQFVRFPGGRHGRTGRTQRVLYFDETINTEF